MKLLTTLKSTEYLLPTLSLPLWHKISAHLLQIYFTMGHLETAGKSKLFLYYISNCFFEIVFKIENMLALCFYIWNNVSACKKYLKSTHLQVCVTNTTFILLVHSVSNGTETTNMFKVSSVFRKQPKNVWITISFFTNHLRCVYNMTGMNTNKI